MKTITHFLLLMIKYNRYNLLSQVLVVDPIKFQLKWFTKFVTSSEHYQQQPAIIAGDFILIAGLCLLG